MPDKVDTAVIKLRKDVDGIHAYVNVPGAIVAATASTLKEALANLAETLNEDDQPFWH